MPFPDNHTRNRIIDLWGTVSEEVHKRFGLTPSILPKRIEIVQATDCKGEFGGTLQAHTLFINEDAVSGTISLKGTIARICLASALPDSNICAESIRDTSTEFARQIIDKQERTAWSDLWAKQVPEKKLGGRLVYNPSKSFPAIFEMTGSEGLDTIIRDLLSASKYDVELILEEYLRYFEGRIRRFTVSLTKTNLQIVDYLLKNPNSTFEAIANKLRLSPEWVSARISEMRGRNILHKFEVVRFSRIGIRMFHMLLSTDADEDNPHKYLAKCPFLYSTSNVLSGEWSVFAILAVPDNMDNIRALQSFQNAASKWNVKTYSAEVVSSGTRFCLDYYSSEKMLWAIPWDLERVQLAKIYEGGLATMFPRVDEPKNEGRLQLDELDMRILDAVWNRLTSVSKIRANLKVGQKRVADRLKLFRKQGLISTQWEVHNIGLTEFAFATTENSEIGRAIAAWSLRLPRCIVSFDLDGRMLMQGSFPIGGGYGFAWALGTLPKVVSIGLLSPPIYGNWGFPLDLWNSNKNSWNCPRQKIGGWLESIR